MKQNHAFFMAMAFAIAGCDALMVEIPAVEQQDGTTIVSQDVCQSKQFFIDGDGDGFGKIGSEYSACSPKAATDVMKGGDCNDAAAGVNPDAVELCDAVDNNCNGKVDDTTKSWWLDHDTDGHGDPKIEIVGGCSGVQKNFVANNDDCNDSDGNMFAGNKEICDGIDNDCDTQVDEGVKSTFYADVDGDGQGDPKKPMLACVPSKEIVVLNNDCDDGNKKVFLGAAEVCNLVDDDCDGKTDEDVLTVFYKDSDGDGHGDPKQTLEACSLPPGATETKDDCNDDPKSGKNVFPSAAEVCNEIDDNCDGKTDEGVKLSFYFDNDGDGFAGAESPPLIACTPSKGYYAEKKDCDDSDKTVFPSAPELCDGKDNACAGLPLPPKEADALCNDKNKFTNDFCLGAVGCKHEDQKLLMTCSNPEKFPVSDGYTCGVVYYFGDALVDKVVVPTFEKEAASPLMEDVCEKLVQEGKKLHVSAFVQLDFDPKFTWIDASFMKLIDSFSKLKINKSTPGNVTFGETIEYDLTAADIPACQ